MKKILLLALLWSLNALALQEVHCPGPGRDFMVADPAIVEQNNSILVMGTGDILKYKNLSTLVKGTAPQKVSLTLFKEISVGDKKVILHLAPQELPWDLQFYELDGKKYLYGGVMSPLPGSNEARWPENLDNFRRCLFVSEISLKIVNGKLKVSLARN